MYSKLFQVLYIKKGFSRVNKSLHATVLNIRTGFSSLAVSSGILTSTLCIYLHLCGRCTDSSRLGCCEEVFLKPGFVIMHFGFLRWGPRGGCVVESVESSNKRSHSLSFTHTREHHLRLSQCVLSSHVFCSSRHYTLSHTCFI